MKKLTFFFILSAFTIAAYATTPATGEKKMEPPKACDEKLAKKCEMLSVKANQTAIKKFEAKHHCTCPEKK